LYRTVIPFLKCKTVKIKVYSLPCYEKTLKVTVVLQNCCNLLKLVAGSYSEMCHAGVQDVNIKVKEFTEVEDEMSPVPITSPNSRSPGTTTSPRKRNMVHRSCHHRQRQRRPVKGRAAGCGTAPTGWTWGELCLCVLCYSHFTNILDLRHYCKVYKCPLFSQTGQTLNKLNLAWWKWVFIKKRVLQLPVICESPHITEERSKINVNQVQPTLQDSSLRPVRRRKPTNTNGVFLWT
jgi:hypothetical protein